MDIFGSILGFLSVNWVAIGVGLYLAGFVVKWTPFTQDDDLLALIISLIRRVTGKDPRDVVGK